MKDPRSNELGMPLTGHPVLIYASLLMLVSCWIGWWLDQRGVSFRWTLVLPLLSLMLVSTRLRVLATSAPALLFLTIGIAGWENSSIGLLQNGSLPLAIACLLFLALVMRFQSYTQPVFSPDAVTVRIVAARRPEKEVGSSARVPESFHGVELLPLLLIPIAWFAAELVVGWAVDGLSAAERDYGLVPQGLWIVKLTITLAVLFLICQGTFGYIRERMCDRDQASLRLRREIWSWNGSEQRLIARRRRSVG